ncbi:MAG: glycosyltransferase family A protein, partial [Parcubacteria group bacterium]
PAEIVVVDDGSTNQTRQQVANLSRHYHGIKVILAQHGGQALARNRGIRATTSDFILCLDGDDKLRPNALEKAAGVLASRPEVDFVYGWSNMFGSSQGTIQYPPWDICTLLRRDFVQPSCFMFRRSLFERTVGFGEYLTKLGGYDDWDFIMCAAETGARGQLIPDVLVDWRRHSGADSARMDSQHKRLRRALYQRHFWFILEQSIRGVSQVHTEVANLQKMVGPRYDAQHAALRVAENQVSALAKELYG